MKSPTPECKSECKSECKFIKKAHAAIICGATDCGKTEFTLNLLETEYKQFL